MNRAPRQADDPPSLRDALDVLEQVDFSEHPGLYDLMPWAKIESAVVAEIATRRLASPPIHLVIDDEPTGWERAEQEAARF